MNPFRQKMNMCRYWNISLRPIYTHPFQYYQFTWGKLVSNNLVATKWAGLGRLYMAGQAYPQTRFYISLPLQAEVHISAYIPSSGCKTSRLLSYLPCWNNLISVYFRETLSWRLSAHLLDCTLPRGHAPLQSEDLFWMRGTHWMHSRWASGRAALLLSEQQLTPFRLSSFCCSRYFTCASRL